MKSKKILAYAKKCALLLLILPANKQLFLIGIILTLSIFGCYIMWKKYHNNIDYTLTLSKREDVAEDFILGLVICGILGYLFFYRWYWSGVISEINTEFRYPILFFLSGVTVLLSVLASFEMGNIISKVNLIGKCKQHFMTDDIHVVEERHIISRSLACAMLLYLYLPLALFVFGWIRLWIGIPVLCATFYGLYLVIGDISLAQRQSFMTIKTALFYIIVIVCFFVFCGHGGLMAQDGDWNKHHAILYDLMKIKWPVVYKNDALLTYYIGQYMVPAFLGKLTGGSTNVVNVLILLWNSIGLFLVFDYIVQYFKATTWRKKFFLFSILIVWGGAIILGKYFYRIPENSLPFWRVEALDYYKWLDMGQVRVHFASNFDVLRGAFQHVIPVWISCCLLLANSRNIKNYVAVCLPLLFFATFGFVYFAVFLICVAICKIYKESDKIKVLKTIFSKENLLFVPLAIILILYMSGNFFSEKPSEFGFGFLNMFGYIRFYVIFVIVEFMGYAMLIRKKYVHDDFFYIIIFELSVIPFITMGMWNDLCSRGSIPARFILMVMCIEYILDNKSKLFQKIGVLFLICMSALNLVNQSRSIVVKTIEGWETKSFIEDEYGSYEGYAGNPEVNVDDAYNYYTLDYSHSVFSIIAKQ